MNWLCWLEAPKQPPDRKTERVTLTRVADQETAQTHDRLLEPPAAAAAVNDDNRADHNPFHPPASKAADHEGR